MIDLAIIPARAGSVGLPGKNVAELGGVPLIGWTVRAAIASAMFKTVLVSTDGADIARAAGNWGAQVPFVRPSELATADARSVDVISHALDATQTNGTFALLQPTSPFRSSHHLRQAVAMFEDNAKNAVVSVSKGKPSAWLFSRSEAGILSRLTSPQALVHRRQDSEATFAPNGAIYLCTRSQFEQEQGLFPLGVLGFVMDEIDSLDIDDAEDLALARAVAEAGLRKIDR
jgi:CMP-N,N'-diacetyllegionaminic acid synthase